MFLSLSKVHQDAVVRLVAATLQQLLEQELARVVAASGEEQLMAVAAAGAAESEERLVQNRDLVAIGTTMLYLESLLENFTLGELGLKQQLPLGMWNF